MASFLNIAGIQFDMRWERPEENIRLLEDLISGQDLSGIDLLVLPEMFTTGFTMNTEKVAEQMDGLTVNWMKQLAERLNCTVTGSVVINEGDRYFNRLLWVTPRGEVDYYNKKHLFTLAGEDRYYHPGDERKIFSINQNGEQWKICPLICYDLRFPVWSRNTEAYDVLVYVANFPEKRDLAWTQLLRARAIENQAFVIGVNRIGKDGSDILYIGNSAVIDFAGEYLWQAESRLEIFRTRLDKEKLKSYRRAYNFLRDRDDFILK